MKKDIQKILKESKKCEENSPARKKIMLEYIREYVTKNGQKKTVEILEIKQPHLSLILSGERTISETLLRSYVEKILKC